MNIPHTKPDVKNLKRASIEICRAKTVNGQY